MEEDKLDKLNSLLSDYIKKEQDAERQGNTIRQLRLELHDFRSKIEYEVQSLNARYAGLSHAQVSLNSRLAQVESNSSAHDETIEVHGATLERYGKAIVQLRRRAKTGEDDTEMATGSFEIRDIRHQVQSIRAQRIESERVKADNAQWWKRQAIMWTVAGIAWAITFAIGVTVTYQLAKGR